MSTERRGDELDRLERLETIAETQEEALRETLGELREEIDELRADEAQHDRHPFGITVNNRPAKITGHHHTGSEIKAAAIASGVPIKSDFVLSEELSHGRSRIVGDDQRIRVEVGACFEAIPNDDHS